MILLNSGLANVLVVLPFSIVVRLLKFVELLLSQCLNCLFGAVCVECFG